MKIMYLTVLLMLLHGTANAQNPCTDATPPLVVNPLRMYTSVPEFNVQEIDGGPRISSFTYALFAEGADPVTSKPVQGPSTVPKASLTLVSGTVDCYLADLPAPIPTGQRLEGRLKAVRDARTDVPAASSDWSAASNPFGVVPAVISPPGAPKFRP